MTRLLLLSRLARRSFLSAVLVFCGLLFPAAGSAQTDSTELTLAYPDTTAQPKPAPKPFVFKPTLGLGTGLFSYYGDLYQKHFVNPSLSRIGYELSLSQPVTPYLRLSFYTMFGKLGANERLIYRNVNFESQIRIGGVHFEYNFANFMPGKRSIRPWVSVGFESFEFLTKTDLYDANGNLYFSGPTDRSATWTRTIRLQLRHLSCSAITLMNRTCVSRTSTASGNTRNVPGRCLWAPV